MFVEWPFLQAIWKDFKGGNLKKLKSLKGFKASNAKDFQMIPGIMGGLQRILKGSKEFPKDSQGVPKIPKEFQKIPKEKNYNKSQPIMRI